MKNHISNQLTIITNGLENLEGDTDILVNECIAVIRSGGKIIASGLGKNVPICEKFIGTLNSVGIASNFLHTNSAIHGDLGIVKNPDLAIILSKSGNTEETIYLAKLLRDRKITTWLLTCSPSTKIDHIIDHKICIPIDHEGDPWNLIPNNSTLVFLIFLQALAMKLIERLEIPLSVFKTNHPGGNIGEKLKGIT